MQEIRNYRMRRAAFFSFSPFLPFLLFCCRGLRSAGQAEGRG